MNKMAEKFFKVIKTISSFLLLIMVCSILGCVTSYCSGAITIAKDYTQIDIVGIISYKGFPIWYYEAADGYSIMYGWRLERIYANWGVWTIFFMIIILLIWKSRFVKKKR